MHFKTSNNCISDKVFDKNDIFIAMFCENKKNLNTTNYFYILKNFG